MDDDHPLLLLALCCGFHLCTLFAVATRPSPYRWMLFIPVFVLNISLLLAKTGSSDYMTGFQVIYIFTASDYILLSDVQRELRFQGQTRPISDSSLSSRLLWALRLLTTPRCIGWSHERASVHPSHPKSNRKEFIISQVQKAIVYTIILDIAETHNRWNPCYRKDGPPFGYYGWSWQLVNFVGFAAEAYANMSMVYCLASIATVATHLSEAWEWPPLFGLWSDSYTVRKFWGQTWHQIYRRILTINGQWVAHRAFRLRRGTNASSYVQLYIAFFISGFIHHCADYKLMGNWTDGGSMKFFLSQAVAISFEDTVIALAKRLGIEGSGVWTRRLGYVWVWVWFAYSMPFWLEPIFRAGMVYSLLPFSVITGLWKGDWTPN